MESDLPLEVISNILSYLDGCQRLTSGLVCKRWLQASDILLEDVCLTITGRPLHPMRTLSRRFSHITFQSTDIDDECVDFLNHHGPQLLHLQFVDCRVHSRRKVVDCHRLKVLDTEQADVLLVFASLPCLEGLHLPLADDLNDEILMAFDKIASSNLSFFMMPTRVVYERLVYMRFYPENTTYENHPSEYILSFPALENFMRKRAKTLTAVELPKTIGSDAALRLSKVNGLALQNVHFGISYCYDVVLEFCRNQPRVIVLNVSGLRDLPDDDVVAICGLLPALREFSAGSCHFLNTCVVSLFGMRHLRKIRLNSCYGIVPGIFQKVVSSFAPPNLHTLDLSYTKIPDRCILDLLPRIPLLVELYLSGCSVSNGTLVAISRQLTRLRVLELRTCHGLSDLGLSGRCEESGVALSNLAGLVKLDLCACTGFTHGGIVEVVRFRHLRSLYLTRCTNITSCTLTALMKNNPCLTDLQWEN